MRKISVLFLVLALVLLLCGIAAAEGEGKLFLTVSEITFSLVGESENIYAGSVPADQVLWESENEDVIFVANGILRAEGVGSTVIRGTYGDQVVECKASCLAGNFSSLNELGNDVLRKPMRIPSKVDMDPAAFFSDAVLVGDSVSYNLFVHETKTGMLGHPQFLARKNVSVFNFVNHILNANYQGQDMYIEDAIAACGAKKAFFLLGMNDLGFQDEAECAALYGVLIDRVQEKNPDVQIYIQTCLPRFEETRFANYDVRIDTFNALVREIAESRGCIFIDIARYIKDHCNGMASIYSMDQDVHLNYEGSVVWMDVLRGYAYAKQLEEMK